jgi:hypothetical protein
MKLTPEESLLTEQELFFYWLLSDRVSFKELSEAYVQYLEHEKEQEKQTIRTLSSALLMYYSGLFNFKKNKKFKEAKTAYALLKSNCIIPEVKEELKSKLQKLGYSEDENGFPMWEGK